MAWEQRRGGRQYYYRGVKVAGRVRKLYLGAGPAGAREAERVARLRAHREGQHVALLAEQGRLAPAERALEERRAATGLLVWAALVARGFHLRRGQWRRRRYLDVTETCKRPAAPRAADRPAGGDAAALSSNRPASRGTSPAPGGPSSPGARAA